ncbi:MAG: hypothetical protein Q8P67_29150, partial [archaeon]|nr:hypothetical protein [archaeon]
LQERALPREEPVLQRRRDGLRLLRAVGQHEEGCTRGLSVGFYCVSCGSEGRSSSSSSSSRDRTLFLCIF